MNLQETEQHLEFRKLAPAPGAQESQAKAVTSHRYPSFFAAVRGFLAGALGREALYKTILRYNLSWAELQFALAMEAW